MSVLHVRYTQYAVSAKTCHNINGYVHPDQELHIPVRVWLEHGYPKDMPMVNLNPAGDMTLVRVDYVDKEGRVNLHYVIEWTEVSRPIHTHTHACVPPSSPPKYTHT